MKNSRLAEEISQLNPRSQLIIANLVKELKHSSESDNDDNFYLVSLPKSVATGSQAVAQIINTPEGLSSLIDNLLSLEFLEKLEQKDPLLEAKLKGIKAKQELLNYQGRRALTSEEVAIYLNMTRQAVDKRRKQNKLLGILLGKRGYRYPAWQFDDGRVLAGWEQVLANMEHLDDWSKLIFMVTGDIRLDGKTPLECLQKAQVEQVILAAKSYGLQYPS